MPVLESRVRSGPEFERNRSGYRDPVETLRERHRRVLEGVGEKLRRRHRERGKIPVWERIDHLIDRFSPFQGKRGKAALPPPSRVRPSATPPTSPQHDDPALPAPTLQSDYGLLRTSESPCRERRSIARFALAVNRSLNI
jgi:hypothetical protein